MAAAAKPVQRFGGIAPDAIPFDDLLAGGRPAILEGIARDWPIVERGAQSPRAAIDYLAGFDGGRTIVGYTGAPEINGRFFYNEAMTGLNFEAKRIPLTDFLETIAAHLDEEAPPSFYIGSTDLDLYLPGFAAENALPRGNSIFAHDPLASIWIGNRTVASAHYDMSNNLAVCVVGHRRFTLFPPDQIANLYPGPFQPTPGGQVVSMVDVGDPDLDRYPRFAEALAAAEVAELAPGDALFYPAMWWHHVEALDRFNAMVNYWWNPSPSFVDTPMTTLLHALLSLRDRPEAEKQAWRGLFDYYVFGPPDRPAAHLPEHARGVLGTLDEPAARRLRAELLQRLNR
jgi:hypothetical protein